MSRVACILHGVDVGTYIQWITCDMGDMWHVSYFVYVIGVRCRYIYVVWITYDMWHAVTVIVFFDKHMSYRTESSSRMPPPSMARSHSVIEQGVCVCMCMCICIWICLSCNALQHTATHVTCVHGHVCPATHCNTLQHMSRVCMDLFVLQRTAGQTYLCKTCDMRCSVLQCVARQTSHTHLYWYTYNYTHTHSHTPTHTHTHTRTHAHAHAHTHTHTHTQQYKTPVPILHTPIHLWGGFG